jgi:hypothetical protein
MLTVGTTAADRPYEFLSVPRIGEKIVIKIGTDNLAFRVTEVTQYARGVDGSPQILLTVTSAEGA